jgi:hypothetical protein
MPVQGHRHGTLQGYRTVAVADTVGLACVGVVIVESLHRCSSLHALHALHLIAWHWSARTSLVVSAS